MGRAGRVLAAATLAPALLPTGVIASSAADGEAVTQVVALDRSTVAVGDVLVVELSGWPAGPAQVELCGNTAKRGTVDCDPLGATATGIDADGAGAARLVVGQPPSPCPCVVRVSQAAGASTAVPIEVVGGVSGDDAPDAASVRPERRVEVLATTIERDEGNAAVFGVDAGRRVSMTVRNAGTVVLTDVTVSGTLSGWGAGARPITSPPSFVLEPGAERQVVVAFDLPSPAVGDYRFVGRVDGGDEPIEFSVGTGHMPWALINLGALLVVAGIVIARRRSRRRRRRMPSSDSSVPGQTLPGEATPVS